MLEEFGIYLNYVRKLGFEETPDYDFLRELFVKVMKNNGDMDDGVFDWNLLNGMFITLFLVLTFVLTHVINYSSLEGRGWESTPGVSITRLLQFFAELINSISNRIRTPFSIKCSRGLIESVTLAKTDDGRKTPLLLLPQPSSAMVPRHGRSLMH